MSKLIKVPKIVLQMICRKIRRTFLCLVKKVSRLTMCTLCGTSLSVVLFYIIIKTWRDEMDAGLEVPLNYSIEENISRTFLPETLNPPIVWWNPGYRLTDETIQCPNNIKCDAFTARYKLRLNSEGAYLFYASRLNFNDLPLPRNPKKVLWALSHEESPRNVPELSHESALNLFNISSTFSRHSDVPFPLQYMESLDSITSRRYFVATKKKNKFLKEIAPVIFMNSNCNTYTDRDNYVKELMKYIPIDSYGECLKNKDWPGEFPKDHLNNLNEDMILDFIARYKFVIAIENGVCEDYITEKFWRPIKLGVVPIYHGSPSIRDWFPNNKSAILIEDFPSPKSLSDHLHKLLEDDALYEEYLDHKTKGKITNEELLKEIKKRPYQTDVEKTNIEFECYVCKKLHENRMKVKKRVVTKDHYNCSIPISVLTKQPIEAEMPFWDYAKHNAERLYRKIRSTR